MNPRIVHNDYYITFDSRVWRIDWDTPGGLPSASRDRLVYVSPQANAYGVLDQILVYRDDYIDDSTFLGTARDAGPAD